MSQTCGVPSALSKNLDDAFALWKQLLATPGVPAVRSLEQTVASLHLLAVLYKLMAKVTWPAGRQPPRARRIPLRWSLSVTRGVFLPPAPASHGELPPGQSPVRHARGQPGHGRRPMPGHQAALPAGVSQLRPGESGREGRGRGTSSADPRDHSLSRWCVGFQLFLEETESCLQKADSSDDSYLLLQQTCLLLRSQLCCVNHRVRLLKKTPFLLQEWCQRARGDCSGSAWLSQCLSLGTLGVETPWMTNGDAFFSLSAD